MKRWSFASAGIVAILSLVNSASMTLAAAPASGVDLVLNQENQERGVKLKPVDLVDDLTFLRRISIDLIGRIPTTDEIKEFMSWSSTDRRTKVIDKLLAHGNFADRWTIFFGDMLRLRSNAEGGAAATAFVHQAIEKGMPYDVLCRRLIAATGKAGALPEVGFILGDNADPMALAGVTAQTFMGIRVACAQCHDHPFDVWTRKDFYGMAAYFGKTRRMETTFTNIVYTTEVDQTTVLWPPEGVGEASERKPMPPVFLPFQFAKDDELAPVMARLTKLRQAQAKELAKKEKKVASLSDTTVDDLLNVAADKADKTSSGKGSGFEGVDVVAEAKEAARNLNLQTRLYRQSKLRLALANLVTSPRNPYFSRSFANRIWGELVGRGFVEPVDNFTESNQPSHPKTLGYLADEFVASGYDLKTLIRLVVTSEAYQRKHAADAEPVLQAELEASFLATSMRRMLSESMYDSIVVAGHIFDVKHEAGKNMKIVWQQQRIAKPLADAGNKPKKIKPVSLAADTAAEKKKMEAMMKAKAKAKLAAAYNVEKAIELDFEALLKGANDKTAAVDKMRVMSKEEIEAMRMAAQNQRERPNVEYFDRFVRTSFDDNPKFSSAMRMAAPAAPEHFVRIFGQPGRAELGDIRDHNPSMRGSLLMLNGRLTHEASRVGELEPVYALVAGKSPNVDEAIRLCYMEILTRTPEADELAEAKSIVDGSQDTLAGIADLRWILLNCNEFRFIP